MFERDEPHKSTIIPK